MTNASQTARAVQLRRVGKWLLPPIAIDAARGLRARAGLGEWAYLPDGWPTTPAAGWDDQSIVDAQLSRWPSFVSSVQEPHPLGRSTESGGSSNEADLGDHNTAMAFAYVLLQAALGRTRLSMLDWGGGLGQYAVLARALAPGLEIEYHCRDLALLVRAGRSVLPHDTFHDTDESAFALAYDLVMASSSLQYVRDWRETLTRLAAASRSHLFVTRQPVVQRAPSFVVLQRPHRHGYRTEYPGWFLNQAEFLEAVASLGMPLRREFFIWERPHVPGAPEQAEYRGLLFSRVRPAG